MRQLTLEKLMDKDLQYYLDHPDEVPDDPAVLAQLAEQMNTPVVADDPDPTLVEKDVKKEDPASSAAAKETKEPVVTEVTTQGKEEGDVLRPDGKGVIPYTVLKTERERRQAAEAAVADLSSKFEELQAQLAKGTSTGDAKAEQLGDQILATMSPEELEALNEDFPVFGKAISGMLKTIESLNAEVVSLKRTEETREAVAQRNTASTVQELIDAEPILVHLQANDPELFARAVEIDKTLMNNPRYPDMASRFAKVAEIMDSTFGPFEGVTPKKAATATQPSVDKEAAKKAVLEQVSTTKVTPKSLSDIPAGDPPESDELARLENLSAVELSDRLLKMTADQRTAFLNRF